MLTGDKLDVAIRVGAFSALADAFWYGLIAGGAWLCFEVFFASALRHRKISRHPRKPAQLSRETRHSVRSVAIFGLVTAGVVYAALNGWTLLYLEIEQYGWTWFVASIGVMVVVHDAYFYWTHRLMHHRYLYRPVHKTHHLSTAPSAWAAYAFSRTLSS